MFTGMYELTKIELDNTVTEWKQTIVTRDRQFWAEEQRASDER